MLNSSGSLYICALNTQGLASAVRLQTLSIAVELIKFDVIGLSEIRRAGTSTIPLTSGHLIYYHGDGPRHGVGFLVNQRHLANVSNFRPISGRICTLDLKIPCSQRSLRLISVYAPTSDYADIEYDQFTNTIKAEMKLARRQHMLPILLGDLNARVGRKEAGDLCIGPHLYRLRNHRGQSVVNLCHSTESRIWNTFFQKKPSHQWTWRHPAGVSFHQIDYLIAPARAHICDVNVLNQFNFASDHRLLRARLLLPRRWFRPSEKKRQQFVTFPYLVPYKGRS